MDKLTLPSYLQRLIDENEKHECTTLYADGVNDTYKAMCEPALDGKVDRAIERIVLDWLQWCEDLIDALQSRLNIAVECLREACEELEFRMESNSEVTPSGNSGKHDKSVSAGFSILLRAREVLKQINPKGG